MFEDALRRLKQHGIPFRLTVHGYCQSNFMMTPDELKRELTVVIVTHNLQQAARVSDRTAFFFMGKLVEADTTERMFTSPREERTDAYITGRFG